METITTMITTIATAISAFIAATTLLLTFLKYREKTKAEHANRMFEMLMRTRKNPDTINFFQMIDYSENEGTQALHAGGTCPQDPLERQQDRRPAGADGEDRHRGIQLAQ